jgi:hypothetical protein
MLSPTEPLLWLFATEDIRLALLLLASMLLLLLLLVLLLLLACSSALPRRDRGAPPRALALVRLLLLRAPRLLLLLLLLLLSLSLSMRSAMRALLAARDSATLELRRVKLGTAAALSCAADVADVAPVGDAPASTLLLRDR